MRLVAAALLLLAACARSVQRFEPVPGRPYDVKVGPRHDAKKPAPVLFLLHAYATPPATQESYFQFGDQLERRGWILVIPRGTVDQLGNPYWNATEACCDRFGKKVDELAYLDQVFDDVKSRFAVDEKAVFALGMSNGGFLAHRLACERSERFTAIASIVGAGFIDGARCQPKKPVAVLQVHGDQDELVLYDGGTKLLGADLLGPYADARTPLVGWAERNKCEAMGLAEGGLDFDKSVPGRETQVERWGECSAPVELWTVKGGKHYLPPSSSATAQVLQFFLQAMAKSQR